MKVLVQSSSSSVSLTSEGDSVRLPKSHDITKTKLVQKDNLKRFQTEKNIEVPNSFDLRPKSKKYQMDNGKYLLDSKNIDQADGSSSSSEVDENKRFNI